MNRFKVLRESTASRCAAPLVFVVVAGVGLAARGSSGHHNTTTAGGSGGAAY
jgi:hypothetical protein